MSQVAHLRETAEKLLAELAQRSSQRPGLFPVRDPEAFSAIIADRLGWRPEATLADASDPQELAAFCDLARQLNHRPEDSHHWFALSQLRRGFPPLGQTPPAQAAS